MLLSVDISEKSFGAKSLFSGVRFSVNEGEKVGLIGRNGVGKTTLLHILMGRDTDFTGECVFRRGAVRVATEQEYSEVGEMSVMEYVLAGLPEFMKLYQVLQSFTEVEAPNNRQIREYSEAVERFSDKGYYFVEEAVREELKNFQFGGYETRKFAGLSGGEKRLVEVVKIMHAGADLAVVDEPTNFMDYVAKAKFCEWMRAAPEAVLVITHDRDVLGEVDRIVEIKDGAAVEYRGGYEAYLAQNAMRTSSGMNEYEVVQRQIVNLRKQTAYARSKKASWTGTADKRNPFVVMENRCQKQMDELLKLERPSFWIDKKSVTELDHKAAGRYGRYKARNVRIGLNGAESRSRRLVVRAENLSAGYERALFGGVNFELREREVVEIRGRNGAGKSTLVKALLGDGEARVFDGAVFLDAHVRIGRYEQEVSREYFDLTLRGAIEKVYDEKKLRVNETKIRQLMADYLFDESDLGVKVAELSGGQKARLQIIKMLREEPQLLVLDEPTSHLDLPSIEELENALVKYTGAVIYISHDNYFRRALGGSVVGI